METRSNHVLVGGVVMGLIVAVIAFIIWLSQLSGEDTQRYDIFFKQAVDGLAKGSAVTFSGVPVGQIESINLEPKTPEFIRVRISVRSTTPILQGTTATIQGVGFTGVSQIQLDPAPSGAPPIQCPETDPLSQCPYGVPVIPTKPGALGQLLNSAPELLERVSTLAERLTELLSDRNQASIASILENVQDISRSLADRSPEIAATLAETRTTLRQAGVAAEQIGQLAGTTNQMLNQDGKPLVQDLRKTVQSAERSLAALEQTLNETRPAMNTVATQTLPEVNILVRDLRATSESLRSISEKIDRQGAGALIGSPKLPDYEP
ncbi:MlaD family protein [Allosphingosinicella indica]|uniref:Phospholipid/cholesterol/gamma-HCH transport system substrate-binding protein n=1 Tax=Allosphingosinicella indica TaxID=941907 RepID=A0A1X7G8T3_9SPHN|nr:MlaD family protein [Allosphingosinicella indica]SMF65945.1 phospholipid/cholesterol/gamma-HCH transport system substrate-binding protein [Allosphingosinicella indica]